MHPNYASIVRTHTILSVVLLPPILGPVKRRNFSYFPPISIELETKLMLVRQGCFPSVIMSLVEFEINWGQHIVPSKVSLKTLKEHRQSISDKVVSNLSQMI